MKHLSLTIIAILSILLVGTCLLLFDAREDVKEKDTRISLLYGGMNELQEELNERENATYIIDSLNVIIANKNIQIDSLKSNLDIANFKLERIKYYNKVAANGNNVKFLRGWINRVIND